MNTINHEHGVYVGILAYDATQCRYRSVGQGLLRKVSGKAPPVLTGRTRKRR